MNQTAFFSHATPISHNQTVDGCLNSTGDYDYFTFMGNVGETINVNVKAESIDSQLEAFRVFLYQNTTILVQEDYSFDGGDLSIVQTIQETDDYYVEIYSTSSVGEYQLVVSDNSMGVYEIITQNTSYFSNFPNPFNPSTTLFYSLLEQAYVTLTIYDFMGREINQLVNITQQPGFKQSSGMLQTAWADL